MPPRAHIDDDVASLISSNDSINAMDFVQRANQMMADTKKRRDAKRTKIENDRAKRIKDIKKKLAILYENRRAQRAKLQQAQRNKLYALNKRRQELEGQILESMMLIENSTLAMARELSTVLVGRLNVMNEITDTQAAA